MRLAAFVLLFLTVVAKLCFAGLTLKRYAPGRPVLAMASIHIWESCYAKQFSTVGLAGPLVGVIFRRMASKKTVIPSVLIDTTSREANQSTVDRASRHKLQVFMVTVTNSSALAGTLVRVKNSKWWDHMASFFLINWSRPGDGCSKAYQMLWLAWKMDLLNSKFVCIHRTRGILIYTFNPYTSKAPVPWRPKRIYGGMKGRRWTLFAREYREDDPRCDALDFDKTLDLGGYEICTAMPNKKYFDAGPRVKGYPGEKVRHPGARMLINSINAKWKIMLRPKNYRRNETINPTDLPAEVMEGKCDVYFPLFLQGDLPNSDTTYPAIEWSLAILTKYRGNKSQLYKIISVLDGTSRLGVVAVLLITLSFLKFYLRRPIVLAFMDLVLLTCNAALSKIPRKLAPRIYFGCLLIFVVTIQGIHHSQLAKLLTSNVRLKNIDSIDDLAHSDHTIYGRRRFQMFFNDSAFEERFIIEPSSLLNMKKLDSNSRVALVDLKTHLIDRAARRRDIHLSDQTIGSIHGVYLIRPNWPLERRVNAILRTAATSGILNFLQAMEKLSLKNKLKFYEYEYQHQKIKVMTVKTLRFAFVILAIGLGCATITLIIEVIFAKLIGKHRKCIRR